MKRSEVSGEERLKPDAASLVPSLKLRGGGIQIYLLKSITGSLPIAPLSHRGCARHSRGLVGSGLAPLLVWLVCCFCAGRSGLCVLLCPLPAIGSASLSCVARAARIRPSSPLPFPAPARG